MFLSFNINTEEPIKNSNHSLSADNLDLLLLKIAQNDPNAFADFYKLTYKTIFSFILSITTNHADAQDILQDTYIKIKAGAYLYQSQGKPLAWIFTIAKNLTYMKLRKSSNHPIVSLPELENSPAPEAIYCYEDILLLKESLLILSEIDRQIVFLHAISGLKHREIAVNLQLPLATVLSKYTRSLSKLRKHLRQQGIRL